MQTAINPALAAAMTLERAAQFGEFQPMTREGQPTVAAQLMQKAMPPAIPDVVQQAGLGGQIQAMQMQDAQKELMGRLMAQQKQAPGLMGLNPQMGNFAEGGIVGYANGELVEDVQAVIDPQFGGSGIAAVLAEPERAPEMSARERQRLEEEAAQREFLERNAPEVAARLKQQEAAKAAPAPAPAAPPPAPGGGIQQTLPQAQKAAAAPRPTAGLASSSEKDINTMMGLAKELAQLPKSADPSKTADLAMAEKQAADEFARRTGNDPDMVLKQIQQYEDMYRRRDEQLARRMADLDANKREQGLIEFLLGARGMKGQGIGTTLASGAQASRAFAAQNKAQMERMEDLRMDLESTKAERVNNLRRMKYDTDMGNFNAARQRQQKELELARQEKALEVELAGKVADIRSQEARVRAQVESSAADRAVSRQQGIDARMAELLRQNIANYNKAADDIKDRYKTNPAISAFEAARLSSSGVPPAIENAYRDAIARRDQEIAAQTSDIRKEIDRLQTMIYGPGAVKQAAPAPMYAANPKTGERIMSTDGGKTWQPAR
jgi:hypothetical protein